MKLISTYKSVNTAINYINSLSNNVHVANCVNRGQVEKYITGQNLVRNIEIKELRDHISAVVHMLRRK